MFIINNQELDFSTPENQKRISQLFISKSRTQILSTIENMQQGTFDYSSFTLGRNLGSGLTKMAGIYLMVNQRTKKIYLGGTGDLSQRKADYKKYLNKPESLSKLSPKMREDREAGQAADFYFVPLVALDSREVTNLSGITTESTTGRGKLSIFLDSQVEQPLLKEFLQSDKASVFYNMKVEGRFEEGNRYGGTPQSGNPDKPVVLGNYAWESISGAAKSFNKDRKTIRKRLDNGPLREITSEEFENFVGIKISNAEASEFFQDKQEEYSKLYRELRLK